MKIDRGELKREAKSAIKKQIRVCVYLAILAFILAFPALLNQDLVRKNVSYSPALSSFLNYAAKFSRLLTYPLAVGINGCFISIYRRKEAFLREVFSSCRKNWLNKYGASALVFLLQGGWITYVISFAIEQFGAVNYPRSFWLVILFLCIGGLTFSIFVSCTLAVVPYILAEFPHISPIRAIKLSARIMRGNRKEYFFLGLSFIPWIILGILSFFILHVFYVLPYISTTQAGFYTTVLNNALKSGGISRNELSQ